MNKQEAIDEIENAIPDFLLNDFQRGKETGLSYALELVNQLDEPEKPVVPQFVAEWLEVCKENLGFGLSTAMSNFTSAMKKQPNWVKDWFSLKDNQETFAKAWLYGYEIDKEKLYTVEIPNPNEPDSRHIVLHKDEHNKVYIDWHYEDDWKLLKSLKLTEAEIKEDFDWAFRWAKEVE